MADDIPIEELNNDVLRQQVEYLRKKLNDVLKAANMTTQDDVAAPLACLMADRLMEFLYRGDPEIDAKMKMPTRHYYVEVSILWEKKATSRMHHIIISEHPLLWQDKFRKLNPNCYVIDWKEIPSLVADQLKDQYTLRN